MILSAPPAAHLKCTIPDGAAGTRETLRIMAAMVKDARCSVTIREFSAGLINEVSAGNFAQEAETLFQFVRDSIRYVNDVNGVETLQTPEYTLACGYGDCDDKSSLLAAMLESVGHPCRFVAAGYNRPGEFEHVWIETLVGRDWIAAETTMQVDFGWCATPPNVAETLTAFMRAYI